MNVWNSVKGVAVCSRPTDASRFQPFRLALEYAADYGGAIPSVITTFWKPG
jgi:hypothetical protein